MATVELFQESPVSYGFKNRTIVITGAAAGIGRATALRFAAEGAHIAAWDTTSASAEALVADIAACGGEGLFLTVDVADPASVGRAVAASLERFGRVDVLVNNAGILRDAQLVKWKDDAVVAAMTDDDWHAVIGVNLTGVFNCTRAVAPHMIRQRRGVILSASSIVGRYGNFGQTNYTAAKAGVVAMTQTWARELGRYGIRVNAVAPGFIETGMSASMPPAILQTMVARTPLGRMGRPEDIAEAYAWLASDAAGFVHGAVLSVDGGLVPGT
jgi:3-oxoacyl-[acyl-carrier protein] reductase